MKKFIRILSLTVALVLLCACGTGGSMPKGVPTEALIDFAAREKGMASVDLDAAVMLRVAVNRCEYGEPMQEISDAAVVAAVRDAVKQMLVDGRHDKLSSTATYVNYGFYDAQDAYLFGFSVQQGLLMAEDGRYDLIGLDLLEAVDGVMGVDEWDAYWNDWSDAEQNYEFEFKLTDDSTVFDLAGYSCNRFAQNVDDAQLLSVRVSGEGDGFSSGDAAQVREVFDALLRLEPGSAASEPEGNNWYVRFEYVMPGDSFASTALLCFRGDCLEFGDDYISIGGLDAFFAVAGGTDLR